MVSGSPNVINNLLSSRLWKVLYTHHRTFRLMNRSHVSTTYCLLLDSSLEKFSYKFGLDSEDQETAFKKHWSAINEKDKSQHMTELTIRVRKIKHDDSESKHAVLDYLKSAKTSGNCPYYIKQFLADFEKKKQGWDFSSEEGLNHFKKGYLGVLDRTYMWGKVNNGVICDYWDHVTPIVSEMRNQSKLLRSIAQQGPGGSQPQLPNEDLKEVVPPQNPNNQRGQSSFGNQAQGNAHGGGLALNLQGRQATSNMNNQAQTTNPVDTGGNHNIQMRGTGQQEPSIQVRPAPGEHSGNQSRNSRVY